MKDFITEEMRSIDSQQHVVADCVNQINRPGWVTNSHRFIRAFEVVKFSYPSDAVSSGCILSSLQPERKRGTKM